MPSPAAAFRAYLHRSGRLRDGTGGASGASEAGGVSSGAESAAEGFPLEEKNFGGKEITVLCVDRHTYGVMQFVPDSELKANAVNDAVAERNNLIEEKYGLTIKAVGEKFPIETLRLAVTSGIDDYDMICDTMMGMMPLIPENLYLALDDYIDISHEWWDQNANELLTLNDKHYLLSATPSSPTTIIHICCSTIRRCMPTTPSFPANTATSTIWCARANGRWT